MKGFKRLSDEVHREDGIPVLRRVSLVARHGRAEDSEDDGAKDVQAIAFQCDTLSFTMMCRAEFDQVEILVEEPVRWPDMVVRDISDEPPWQEIIGDYFLADFWEMKNHKGYNDAMQIKLLSIDRTNPSEHIFQFEAIASRFWISRLDPGSWSYDPFAHYPDE